MNGQDNTVIEKLKQLAKEAKLDIDGAKLRRTSSRFCLGVEHGDYNGTELFGVGTDRFIWMAFKPNRTGKIRLFSGNFQNDGVIEVDADSVPAPLSVKDSWARFPFGALYVLKKNGYKIEKGFDAVVFGNIPGGGMSRSASLAINLLLSICDVNGIKIDDCIDGGFKIVALAQQIENEYIGSPCGKLDQIMIYFAKAGMGTHYNPAENTINYVPLGSGAEDFKIVSLDTGTVRPGLEKSTYKVRRSQCEQLIKLAQENNFKISCLADVKDEKLYSEIMAKFSDERPELCRRLKYIYEAQKRFYQMMQAWKDGDIKTVGKIFRQDGIGLRDDYQISGPQLEAMCDIARTVDGVFGERMLGGGDKGAAGALVKIGAVDELKKAVDTGYRRSYPEYADKYAVHTCGIVDGVKIIDMDI